MRTLRFLLPLALLATTLVVPRFAGASPVAFPPLPDGTVEVREEYDVAPFLAAWKANALGKEHLVARPATANQQQYDVHSYNLDLTFTPSGSTVSGTVRTKATVSSGTLTTLDLDLAANFTIDAATSAGVATTWTRSGDVLTLVLDRAYAMGEAIDVTVTYHGTPSNSNYFGFQTVNARQLIWSLSEAYGSRTWWPCKDDPGDKADSVDVAFTTPSALTTVSNGSLVSRVVNGSLVTTRWHERYPIATYLVFIAAYPYTVTNDWYKYTPTDSMLVQFNNYPESVSSVAAVQAKVKDMIAAFAARFGQYPFIAEKYGHAQFQFSGGMEHQTNTCIGAFPEYIVAHELAHQWFGDKMTCHDFHHIWLNEGFATYGEAIWAEATGGTAAYFADINAARYYGSGTIYVPDATNETRVFDSNLSYNKGGWVLHMLRHVLGDATFFAALQQYGSTWAYQSPTTEDFRDVCEAVSGRNLHAYFQEWIYGDYYPVYRPSWSAAANPGGGYDLTLTLQQTQTLTAQVFTMPIDVDVTTASGTTRFVVDDSLATQSFVLHLADAPNDLSIDPDGWILKGVEQVVTNPAFDRAVLVVNGVDWATYGTEITTAYTDQAFSGAYGIDFWDVFAAPSGGYPSPLPTPLGHGDLSAALLGHYRNVIWVGNNYSGDLTSWSNAPILSYLRSGGNVLLMTRQGDLFLTDSLRTYLGINWTTTGATLNDCIAARPWMGAQTLTSTQSLCAVFDTVRTTAESELLFRVSSGFSPTRGIGVVRSPANGAGLRPFGGRFAFLSGRPYRWNHAALKANVTTILTRYFHEPVGSTGVDDAPLATTLALAPPRPNPTRGGTALGFTLPHAGHVRLEVVDLAGRRVRTLADGAFAVGPHEIVWDGRDDRGGSTAAGLYWARLTSTDGARVRRIVRVR